jgi:thiamine-phosphate pyrophosphorylase
VHVGQDDLPADVVRRIIGPDKILGVSASTVDEALQAQRDGAQYIGVGAVYGTATKADAGAAIGVERLKDIAAAVSIPVVAIGGIQTHNISAVIQTGVQGVAVISAVVSQPDVEEATRKLLELVRQNQ